MPRPNPCPRASPATSGNWLLSHSSHSSAISCIVPERTHDPLLAMRIVAASDSSILVGFAEDISAETQRNVLSLFLELQKLRDLRIRNLHPAYSSLLIDFDPLLADHAEITRIVKAAL